MIPVAVNGRFLGQRITGAQRYARELLSAIDACLTEDQALRERLAFTVLVPRGTPQPSLAFAKVRDVGHLQAQFWEQIELPWHTANGVLLNLCNTAPLAGRRMIATILDASVYAVPDAYSLAFRTWYRTMIPMVGRRSRVVITISEFSRRELQRYARIDPSKIVVVYGSGEHILANPADESILEQLGIRPGAYVLAVSSRSRHKNLAGVSRAIRLLPDRPFDVVLAGGGNRRIFSQSSAAEDDQIRMAGYVSDAELRALYQHAVCFVYPSLYEGFGLPPLEAMACGCPVIVSDAAALPEVCGNAAMYCNPRDPQDIARAITRVVGDQSLRQELRCRGLERAGAFRWKSGAVSVLDLIDHVART